MHILIFVVAYNAEKHIADTLSRIPRQWLKNQSYELLILDDASSDNTKKEISTYINEHKELNITSFTNVQNLGYGGNQKKGYQYALEKACDLVVLLHGDGQYAPEYIPEMVEPIISDEADVVLGSRMVNKIEALKGGMPIYKWVGNQILTTVQNLLLGTNFSEFHTGYRAFRADSLRPLPLLENSDYYDFDTEIIIQLVDAKSRFKEISIPTFYGDEISYVNGFKYAWLIVKATVVSRLVKRGWKSDPRFNH